MFTSGNKRSSSSSIKFRSFAIKSASLASLKVAIFQLQAALLRHVLRKVCLQLGRERHNSRARPSPRATSSHRPPSSVLLRKVPILATGRERQLRRRARQKYPEGSGSRTPSCYGRDVFGLEYLNLQRLIMMFKFSMK